MKVKIIEIKNQDWEEGYDDGVKAERQRIKEEIEKWERIDSSMPDYTLGWNMAIKEVLALLENKK